MLLASAGRWYYNQPHTLYSADIGIITASSCEKCTCFVPELVAGSLCQFDPGSASDPFTADTLQYVSTQPALVRLHFLRANDTLSCLPTRSAVTLSMYTLTPKVYRALLKIVVSDMRHWVHTTKNKAVMRPVMPSSFFRQQRTTTYHLCYSPDRSFMHIAYNPKLYCLFYLHVQRHKSKKKMLLTGLPRLDLCTTFCIMQAHLMSITIQDLDILQTTCQHCTLHKHHHVPC